MSEPKVLRVHPTHPSQGAWVEIDATAYDPARHKLYSPPAAAPVTPVGGGKVAKNAKRE